MVFAALAGARNFRGGEDRGLNLLHELPPSPPRSHLDWTLSRQLVALRLRARCVRPSRARRDHQVHVSVVAGLQSPPWLPHPPPELTSPLERSPRPIWSWLPS